MFHIYIALIYKRLVFPNDFACHLPLLPLSLEFIAQSEENT